MQQGERIVRDYYQRPVEVFKPTVKKKKRAAAYCRVSTKQDQQKDSYSHQVSYYTEYIKSRPDEYELVDIFADKGTSGLAMRRRKEFNRMVAMAMNGEIDIIFVKSISRYGRNVIDILSTTRALRDKGVTIVFEKEGINSLDPKCDMMLSILSTLSEDESRSISTNVKWAKEKLFEKGIVRINFNALYGYSGGGRSEIKVNQEEAEEVRGIFHKFLAGWSFADIARDLESRGCKTARGKSTWDKTTIRGMLSQEKYIGDVLLRKTFKKDFMQLYPTKNTGQLPQKYVTNNHTPIVSRETFAAAQAELERRSSLRSSGETGRGRYSGKFAFSNLILCGECGFRFRRHNYRNHAKPYPRIAPVWTCYNHLKNASNCKQLPIKETYLEELFISTLNDLLKDKKSILSELEELIAESISENGSYDNSSVLAIDAEIEKLQSEVMELNRKRARREITQEKYKSQTEIKTNNLESLFDKRDKATDISGTAALEKTKLEAIKKFLQTEREQKTFEKELPQRLLESIIVRSRDNIVFEFKNGLQIKAKTAEVIIPKNIEEMSTTPRVKFIK